MHQKRVLAASTRFWPYLFWRVGQFWMSVLRAGPRASAARYGQGFFWARRFRPGTSWLFCSHNATVTGEQPITQDPCDNHSSRPLSRF
ncbi:MAG TPA: hypothetical protein VGF67_00975 [Ktedonobacteraceae bacterium]